jgi:hypothetical protein
MLKQCFALLLTLCCIRSAAQNDLILLTESGDLFTLFLNDERMNDSAQSIVLARGIYEDTCAVRLVFADPKAGTFAGKVLLREKGRPVKGREFTYSLAEEKCKRVLRFISVNDVASDTGRKNYPPEARIKKIFEQLEKQREAYNRANEIYPAPANCTSPSADSVLADGIKALRDNHIELNRQKDAKWLISHHCLDTKQMLKVMEAFDRQDSRLVIAKFSYDYLYNARDFLDLLQGLKYVSDKDELEKFFKKRVEK